MSHTLTRQDWPKTEPELAQPSELYRDRPLVQGYPGLNGLAFDRFLEVLEVCGDESGRIEILLRRLRKLLDLNKLKRIAVVGCGPKPHGIKLLKEQNFNVVGVEPVRNFVESAREYVGSKDAVLEGAAEAMPLADGSQDIVVCHSVLEHVVSPSQSLDEMFRVLAPGGVAVLTTTNKYRISLSGHNGEYKTRFFNWLPDLVKECFVFQHLHYDPTLANYSELPAVHWFSYASLCALGRQAGFARFYSMLDLIDENEPAIRNSGLRKWLLKRLKYNPWMRALALTQRGDTIIMLKK